MQLMLNGAPNRQRAAEIEDTFQMHRFVVGAAVRAQQSTAADRRNSVYVRGSAQVNLGRLTAYGYFEGGKDLVNQSVFATSATSSSVVAATLRLTRNWSIQGEAFRSRLISSLNPENVFVQVNQGLAVNPVLSRFNQWSFLFRIVRSFKWGGSLPAGNIDQYTIQRIPLTGIVEGFVHVRTADGQQPASGVAIKLESGKTALTDANGRFRFDDVPEGAHAVAIDMQQLPAEYNPGQTIISSVTVGPRRVTRADLDLYALSSFAGRVTVSGSAALDSLEGIVIRLEPGGRYTTTLKDGSFAFYNLPDGNYEASIAVGTLPPEAQLKSPSKAPVSVRSGSVLRAVEFQLERKPVEEKPVRKVLDQTIKGPGSPPK